MTETLENTQEWAPKAETIYTIMAVIMLAAGLLVGGAMFVSANPQSLLATPVEVNL